MDPVVAQSMRLLGADAVEGFHGKRSKPLGDVLGGDDQYTARAIDPTGGRSGHGDRRPDADAHVDTQTGEGPHPQYLRQPTGSTP